MKSDLRKDNQFDLPIKLNVFEVNKNGLKEEIEKQFLEIDLPVVDEDEYDQNILKTNMDLFYGILLYKAIYNYKYLECKFLLINKGDQKLKFLCAYGEKRPVIEYAIDHILKADFTFELVMLLPFYGADINFLDENGCNAAEFYYDLDREDTFPYRVLKFLIKKGININHQNNNGCTPLMCNIHRNRVVKLLIKNNADVNLVDAEGNNVLHCFCRHNFANCDGRIQYFWEYEKDFEGIKYNLEIVMSLINAGIDINKQNLKGDSPLMALLA